MEVFLSSIMSVLSFIMSKYCYKVLHKMKEKALKQAVGMLA